LVSRWKGFGVVHKPRRPFNAPTLCAEAEAGAVPGARITLSGKGSFEPDEESFPVRGFLGVSDPKSSSDIHDSGGEAMLLGRKEDGEGLFQRKDSILEGVRVEMIRKTEKV
jgi:hypothetical protein